MKDGTKNTIVLIIGMVAIIAFIAIVTVFMIPSLSAPKNYTEDQQQALSLASYLGYHTLGKDSIDHYVSQKVYENGVAGIMYRYGKDARNLTETVHDKLEEIGFVTTAIEKESSGGWEHWGYSSFSAVNGDIIVYVTTYFDGHNNYVSISAGPDDYEDDVYKIRIEANDYVSLMSGVKFKSGETAMVEHVAPLAGTIYAIKYPQHRLSGSEDAKVNIEARKSYNELIALKERVERDETFRKDFFEVRSDDETVNGTDHELEERRRNFPWIFFWVGGGHYAPYRYGYPGSGPILSPRGTGYTIRGGGGPGGVK
ncbi:MAG: hypothetical protein MASP_00695 [Candidatus Methanolliviera sp. GoM_asphalt]|nr:MAG: hypothetical protein MASP_00695 [Candidatus Methanolliviera sp. GoM_asphalt]